MPLLFSLAIHDPLAEAQRGCGPQEHLFAFLDDVHATSDVPDRTRTLYDSLGTKLHAQPRIRFHTEKTRVWNGASLCPEGVAELGPEVWNPEGVKILGTPVFSQRFVQEVVEKRLAEEQRLWDAVPTVPDLQAASGPRCHHVLRTLPPSQSEVYARGHDLGMERVMSTLLALPGDPHDQEVAHNIASPPVRMVRSRLETGTQNGASSLLAIHMIHQRLPVVADRVVHKLSDREDLGDVSVNCAERQLSWTGQGFVGRPEWHSLSMGVRPQGIFQAEPGECARLATLRFFIFQTHFLEERGVGPIVCR